MAHVRYFKFFVHISDMRLLIQMNFLYYKNLFSASFANVPQPHHARTMRLNKVKLPATNEIPVDNEKRQAILVDSIFHCFWKKCEYKNSFKHVLCHFREAHGKAYLSKFSP